VNNESTLAIQPNPDREAVERLRSRLIEYNRSQVPDGTDMTLLLEVSGDTGETTAGLYAQIYYSWMFVELLWVAQEARGRGYGSRLLSQAEDQARQRGCHSVWLDTFSFQARGFYEKQGYAVFGELPSYPAGHSRYFLCKKLS
jgi:GNAT superfamily N-acetyltransferase